MRRSSFEWGPASFREMDLAMWGRLVTGDINEVEAESEGNEVRGGFAD